MSTYADQAVSFGAVRWAAERVLAMHVEHGDADRTTGQCGQCQPDGRCTMLQWARVVLAVEQSSGRVEDRHAVA